VTGTPSDVEENKRLVARAVAEAINGGHLDAIDELYSPGIAADARGGYWFTVGGGRIVDWWGLEDNDDRRRRLR
jgi:hypothetical protein